MRQQRSELALGESDSAVIAQQVKQARQSQVSQPDIGPSRADPGGHALRFDGLPEAAPGLSHVDRRRGLRRSRRPDRRRRRAAARPAWSAGRLQQRLWAGRGVRRTVIAERSVDRRVCAGRRHAARGRASVEVAVTVRPSRAGSETTTVQRRPAEARPGGDPGRQASGSAQPGPARLATGAGAARRSAPWPPLTPPSRPALACRHWPDRHWPDRHWPGRPGPGGPARLVTRARRSPTCRRPGGLARRRSTAPSPHPGRRPWRRASRGPVESDPAGHDRRSQAPWPAWPAGAVGLRSEARYRRREVRPGTTGAWSSGASPGRRSDLARASRRQTAHMVSRRAARKPGDLGVEDLSVHRLAKS